jgi:hypothetical protein
MAGIRLNPLNQLTARSYDSDEAILVVSEDPSAEDAEAVRVALGVGTTDSPTFSSLTVTGASYFQEAIFTTVELDSLFFNAYEASIGATFTYNGATASDHRIALGAGTTGATLFGAATVEAARATLGIQTKTGTSTGLAAVGVTDITGLTGYDLEADTWYKLELQYIWTSFSSNFQINFVTTGTLLRGGTTPAIGQANSAAAALSTSGVFNDTSLQLRGSAGDSRTNLPAFGYAYFKTGTAGTGKLQLQLLAGTTLSTIDSSCAVLTKQN